MFVKYFCFALLVTSCTSVSAAPAGVKLPGKNTKGLGGGPTKDTKTLPNTATVKATTTQRTTTQRTTTQRTTTQHTTTKPTTARTTSKTTTTKSSPTTSSKGTTTKSSSSNALPKSSTSDATVTSSSSAKSTASSSIKSSSSSSLSLSSSSVSSLDAPSSSVTSSSSSLVITSAPLSSSTVLQSSSSTEIISSSFVSPSSASSSGTASQISSATGSESSSAVSSSMATSSTIPTASGPLSCPLPQQSAPPALRRDGDTDTQFCGVIKARENNYAQKCVAKSITFGSDGARIKASKRSFTIKRSGKYGTGSDSGSSGNDHSSDDSFVQSEDDAVSSEDESSSEKLECDHVVELQLIKSILEKQGICKALDKYQGISGKAPADYLQKVVERANMAGNLYSLESTVNNKKGKLTQRYINEGSTTLPFDIDALPVWGAVSNYIQDGSVKSTSNEIAKALDTIIKDMMDQAAKDAQGVIDSCTAPANKDKKEQELDDAKKLYQAPSGNQGYVAAAYEEAVNFYIAQAQVQS